MGLLRRPTPGEIMEGGRLSRPCGPGALSRAISETQTAAAPPPNISAGSSNRRIASEVLGRIGEKAVDHKGSHHGLMGPQCCSRPVRLLRPAWDLYGLCQNKYRSCLGTMKGDLAWRAHQSPSKTARRRPPCRGGERDPLGGSPRAGVTQRVPGLRPGQRHDRHPGQLTCGAFLDERPVRRA
jgi:hypothetical protein